MDPNAVIEPTSWMAHLSQEGGQDSTSDARGDTGEAAGSAPAEEVATPRALAPASTSPPGLIRLSANTNGLQHRFDGGGHEGDGYVAGCSTPKSQRLAAERGPFAHQHSLLMRALHAATGPQNNFRAFAEVLSKRLRERDGTLSPFA